MRSRLRSITVIFLFTSLLVLSAVPAFAMHITEGILPAQWALLWFAVSAPFLIPGLRELRLRGSRTRRSCPWSGW